MFYKYISSHYNKIKKKTVLNMNINKIFTIIAINWMLIALFLRFPAMKQPFIYKK